MCACEWNGCRTCSGCSRCPAARLVFISSICLSFFPMAFARFSRSTAPPPPPPPPPPPEAAGADGAAGAVCATCVLLLLLPDCGRGCCLDPPPSHLLLEFPPDLLAALALAVGGAIPGISRCCLDCTPGTNFPVPLAVAPPFLAFPEGALD